jgi:transposase
MRAIRVPPLTETDRKELDELYRTTKEPRLGTRAQMILLSAEQQLKVPYIAQIVRESESTVQRWLRRYLAEGLAGLHDEPRPGRPPEITAQYREQLAATVRRRPRSLNQPYSLWTLQRLADYMAEETGIRASTETVRRILNRAEIVLSRPQHKITSPDPEYEVKKRRLKRPGITSQRTMCSTMRMSSTSVGYRL